MQVSRLINEQQLRPGEARQTFLDSATVVHIGTRSHGCDRRGKERSVAALSRLLAERDGEVALPRPRRLKQEQRVAFDYRTCHLDVSLFPVRQFRRLQLHQVASVRISYSAGNARTAQRAMQRRFPAGVPHARLRLDVDRDASADQPPRYAVVVGFDPDAPVGADAAHARRIGWKLLWSAHGRGAAASRSKDRGSRTRLPGHPAEYDR